MAQRGETEDGLGWGGLVASKAEMREERRQAALEKDAERYRKLRAKAHSLTPLVLDPCCAMLTYTPDGLDAALDALPAVG